MQLTAADIQLLETALCRNAQRDLYTFRRLMHPKHLTGWFQRQLCAELMDWYAAWCRGERPVLLLCTPPQHGKSETVLDFVAWLLGRVPAVRIIYTSFSERLAIRANLAVQRAIGSDRYRRIFPGVRLPSSQELLMSRTREFFEVRTPEGISAFRNTTVRGSITGESLDIGIIDDPIKGREQAESAAARDGIWDWFTDDFLTRFSDSAGLISIATRWHTDDVTGRLLACYPHARVVSWPAIAEHDEPYRSEGEALFPEHKSLEFLLSRKELMAPYSWLSLYQQAPVASGGNLIKASWFKRVPQPWPIMDHLYIFADTASKTSERNDYTVFTLAAAVSKDEASSQAAGGILILDVLRGRWEYPEMKRRCIDFITAAEGVRQAWRQVPLRGIVIEDKSSGTALIQELTSHRFIPVIPLQRNRDKFSRAMDIIGYISSGFVALPEQAPWVNAFLSECEAFTGYGDTHDDQVDTLIDACTLMLARQSADLAAWENLI